MQTHRRDWDRPVQILGVTPGKTPYLACFALCLLRDEIRGAQQRLEGSGIRPPPFEDSVLHRAFLYVSDRQFAAAERLEPFYDVKDFPVELPRYYSIGWDELEN